MCVVHALHDLSLPGTDDGDYSDAVGGSLPEYQEEKAFEQLLAGTEGETKDGTSSNLTDTLS